MDSFFIISVLIFSPVSEEIVKSISQILTRTEKEVWMVFLGGCLGVAFFEWLLCYSKSPIIFVTHLCVTTPVFSVSYVTLEKGLKSRICWIIGGICVAIWLHMLWNAVAIGV